MKEWLKDKIECIIWWWYDDANNCLLHIKSIIEHTGLKFTIKIFTFDISINLELPNFLKHYWHNLGGVGIYLTKHKFLELQLILSNKLKTGFDFTKSIHCDHAGIEMEIYILGFEFSFRIYDNRHWDHEKNKWCC